MSLQTQHDPKNDAEITYWNSAGGRRWVARRNLRTSSWVGSPQATLARAQLLLGERVIDIGCGTGASSIALAKPAVLPDGCWALTFSALMLAATVERLPPRAPVKFERAPSA